MRDMKKEILDKLAEIEEKENVKVLHAVESGSRAWGVESSDSDYDVRFIFVRPKEDYLRLSEKRDVIEWQLDEVLDINGWDLKKTLIQFHKGNATLFEWANSPVVYKTTDEWKAIYESSKQYFSEKAALYHYYGTANSTYKQYLQEDKVKYKISTRSDRFSHVNTSKQIIQFPRCVLKRYFINHSQKNCRKK